MIMEKEIVILGKVAPSVTMKIYISLPITGWDIDERRKRAKYIFDKLKQLFPGCVVFNPLDGLNDVSKPWEWYMARDIPYLYDATHVYFDEGWEKSRGCALERAIFEERNGKIIELPLKL